MRPPKRRPARRLEYADGGNDWSYTFAKWSLIVAILMLLIGVVTLVSMYIIAAWSAPTQKVEIDIKHIDCSAPSGSCPQASLIPDVSTAAATSSPSDEETLDALPACDTSTPEQGCIYVTKLYDTLWTISKAAYGTTDLWWLLCRENAPLLRHKFTALSKDQQTMYKSECNYIDVGWNIIIPLRNN